MAPSAGDDLYFPAAAALKANANDFAAGTAFNSITFTGNGYVITGNGITLNNGLLDSAAAGNNRLNTNLALAGTQVFSVATAGEALMYRHSPFDAFSATSINYQLFWVAPQGEQRAATVSVPFVGRLSDR